MSFGELIDTARRPKKRPNGKTSLTAGKIFPEVADEGAESHKGRSWNPAEVGVQ